MSKLSKVRFSSRSVRRNRMVGSNANLAERVEQLLRSQHFPAFHHFRIKADRGVVTVSGRVSTYYEKQVAISACQHVSGVQSLIDQIEVSDHLILGQV